MRSQTLAQRFRRALDAFRSDTPAPADRVAPQQHSADALAEPHETVARYRIAQDAARLGIHDYDPETDHFWWDARCREIWGVDADTEITSQLFRDSLHPDDRAATFAELERALAGERPYSAEYRIRPLDGSPQRWIRATAQVFFGGAGSKRRPLRLIGTVQDITAERAAEHALKEADRRKDEFLAMLAHELRNPLAPIRNAVQILRLVDGDPGRSRVAREIIERQVVHMTRLIDDLLDVSRITRGQIVLKKEPVSIQSVIDIALESSRPLIDQHRHTLSLEIADATVEGDRARLVQVLTNLLTNSAKFTPAGGHITVSSRRDGNHVVISVRDTGVGIRSEAQARIFELFTQEDVSLERAQGGLGIGLTLVKQLVTLHGGTVGVRSAGAGRGAEFWVSLPTIAAEQPSDEPTAIATSTPRSLDILVVEDNADAAESLRMLLEIHGHSVHLAGDGETGLNRIDELHPDVAFVDLGLPGINGYELAARVCSQSKRPLLIAVSGYGRDEDKQRARAAGFDDHLTKPVDPQRIQSLLRDLT